MLKFIVHHLCASFICSSSFRFRTPHNIRYYGGCLTSCSPTSVTVSAGLIIMMRCQLPNLGFSQYPQHGLAISAHLLLFVVHFALSWIKVAIHFPKGKVRCQRAAIPVDDSCTYSILTTSRTLNCCLSGNTPVFCEFLKLLLYKSPFAQLLQCIFTLSAPASFCICSLGLK